MTQTEQPFERRLTAIAFADVADFSRHMERDDLETTKQWRLLLEEIINPAVLEFSGRIVDIAGDGVLAEFSSSFHAVRWAEKIQTQVKKRQTSKGKSELALRIGINVDDVIIDRESLRGDGVILASRIHQVADPGQIVVTQMVRELIGNRLPVMFHDLGPLRLKNISRRVRVFSLEWSEGGIAGTSRQPYLDWGSRPGVAVLPFRSLVGGESGNYFGEGIIDDIIAGLSRSRSLHVISRASMWKYASYEQEVQKIANELGVSYILHGSVRRAQGKLRINAEFVHIERDRPIWADRFEGTEEEIFDFQDQITTRILGSLEAHLQAAEIDRVRNRPTSSLGAYHCVLKALSQLFLFNEESFNASGSALERAIQLDGTYAQAYAHSAWRLIFFVGEQHSMNPEEDRARAIKHSNKALTLDAEDPFVLSVAGHLKSFVEQKPEEGLRLLDRALAIDENCANAWAYSGITLAYSGKPDDALNRLQNAWRLSPFDRMNFIWWGGAGIAEFVAGNYDQATDWLRKSKDANPRFSATLRMLAATLSQIGEIEEAQSVGHELLGVLPNFRVSNFVDWYPIRDRVVLSNLEKGLLLAGLPK